MTACVLVVMVAQLDDAKLVSLVWKGLFSIEFLIVHI